MKKIIYNRVKGDKLAGRLVYSAMRLESLADTFLFKPMGLTTASFRILISLENFGPQFPFQILESIGSTKSNLTQRLNWLHKNKLIQVRKDFSADRRRAVVTLTPLGKKKIEEVKKLIKKNNLKIEKYFNKKELNCFLLLLDKLNSSLDKCEIINNKSYEKD